MLVLINRITGKEPTREEMAQIIERANEIMRSPRSSPEQIEWAVMIPGANAEFYWESSRAAAQVAP